MDKKDPKHPKRTRATKLLKREEEKRKNADKETIARLKLALAKSDEELDADPDPMEIDDSDEQRKANSSQENSGSNTTLTQQDQGSSSNMSAGDSSQQDQGSSSNTSAGDSSQQDQGSSSNTSAGDSSQQDQGSSSNTSAGDSAQQDQGSSSNMSAGDSAQQDQGSSSNMSAGNSAQQDQGSNNTQSPDDSFIKKEPRDDETSPFEAKAHANSDPDSNPDTEFDHGPPLYEKEEPSNEVNRKTVGWIKHGWRIVYINRYGRRNGPIYRLEDEADEEKYETELPKEQNYNKHNRYGELEVTGSTKLLYNKRHISNIYGVAWEGHGENTDKLRTDLDLIDPKIRPSDSRRPTIYIYVEWEVQRYNEQTKADEKVLVKKWETHSALGRRWKKRTEERVFAAARVFQDRYDEHKFRTSPSRSPSAGAFDEATMRRYRGESPASQSPEPSTTAITGGPLSSVEYFLKIYLNLVGKNRFEELSPDQQAKAIMTWQLTNAK
jgi:hypothetical protein